MIKFNQIITLDNLDQFKMHIAKNNGISNPLDEFIENFDSWIGWNTWRGEGNKNRFNRKYVISFIDFYPQRGTFLFGGIFEIVNTYSDHYDVKLLDDFKDYIGRLKVSNINTTRGSSFKLENYYNDIEIIELLDKSYSTNIFPGYENIDYSFQTVKRIILNDTIDWKTALENVKGVYMLSDVLTGKRYIGSAYGDYGIWARWCQYCENGHGGNKKLIDLVNTKDYNYICENFKFTLLEIHPKFTQDDFIILRESYWKEVMLSRQPKFGYNSN